MSISWKEDAESRQNLGASSIDQCADASFASSDYVTGGYVVSPQQAFGLTRLRGMWLIGAAGSAVATAGGYDWVLDKTGASASPPVYKVRAFTNGTTEASASTDFSGLTLTFKGEGPY